MVGSPSTTDRTHTWEGSTHCSYTRSSRTNGVWPNNLNGGVKFSQPVSPPCEKSTVLPLYNVYYKPSLDS